MGSFLLTLNDSIAKFLTANWPVGEIMALRGTVILFVIIGLLQLKGTKPITCRLGSRLLQSFSLSVIVLSVGKDLLQPLHGEDVDAIIFRIRSRLLVGR